MEGDGVKSRKLWVAVGVGAAILGTSTALVIVGIIDGAQWMDMAKWVGSFTTVGYLGANVVEKLALVLKK